MTVGFVESQVPKCEGPGAPGRSTPADLPTPGPYSFDSLPKQGWFMTMPSCHRDRLRRFCCEDVLSPGMEAAGESRGIPPQRQKQRRREGGAPGTFRRASLRFVQECLDFLQRCPNIVGGPSGSYDSVHRPNTESTIWNNSLGLFVQPTAPLLRASA